MRLIPEVCVPFDHLGSRVANTGASFATGVAYLLFASDVPHHGQRGIPGDCARVFLSLDYPIVGLSTEEDEITRTGRYLYDWYIP